MPEAPQRYSRGRMLSLKSGLGVGMFGAIAIAVGCSAGVTDESDPFFDRSQTEPQADAGNGKKLTASPGKTDGGATSGNVEDDDDDWIGDETDGGTSSSSSSGGGAADAGTSAPEAGESCGTLDEKFGRVCGRCGKQEALCAATRTGALKVTEYGPCGGESGVCATGETKPCGVRCGVQKCGSTCGWGSCQDEGVCKPGVITHESVGCPTPGTYRTRVCTDACQLGTFTACKPAGITVPAPGVTISEEWTLAPGGKRPSMCKKSGSVASVSGSMTSLTNPTRSEVTVQIWHSSAGVGLDTALTVYANKPTTDDDFKACIVEPQDGCSQLGDICNADGIASWGGVDNVKVPAGGTVWIYSSGWWSSVVGKFVLNVKTK